ncbi:AraC family transcriptional regulator [uncultured Ferrimonas sp.]|uniref:AraC family transcriptional regulator n=1 Tax=uncultured Ferrimonas sp. TaxID=432640 RepID=UPI00262F7404|nr:AraC family transcriptional regulator [uncultured Ferrimonas sp.]
MISALLSKFAQQLNLLALLRAIAIAVLLLGANAANANDSPPPQAPVLNDSELALQLEQLKSQVLKLNRDLFILEEDLLFPASTQLAVFVSVDVGRFFRLDGAELKIDGQDRVGFLYTERQRHALEQGGIQRLYLGNIKTGQHQLTAIFSGTDREGRPVERAISHQFNKEDDAVMLELKITDVESNLRAKVQVEQWQL